MEFNKKLQLLRTRAGMTQEQLAEKLFVSRVTVSKWESGRGYPNIDSLRLIAKVMSVSVDSLLSHDELPSLSNGETGNVAGTVRPLFFGVLDFVIVLLLILPLFGDRRGEHIAAVPLVAVTGMQKDILVVMYGLIIVTALFGVTELALQSFRHPLWVRIKTPLSCALSILGVLLLIATRQPYASVFLLFLLLTKGILLIKRK